MTENELLPKVKENLIINFDEDDAYILGLITASISYAESYQHLDEGYYKTNKCSETTKQAIIMLASHLYESRDGSTGGFFANSPSAASQTWNIVNQLLRLDRNWKV